jgi:hypothetical protein
MARLKEKYQEEIVPELMKEFGILQRDAGAETRKKLF